MLKLKRKPGIYLGKQAAAQLRIVLTILGVSAADSSATSETCEV